MARLTRKKDLKDMDLPLSHDPLSKKRKKKTGYLLPFVLGLIGIFLLYNNMHITNNLNIQSNVKEEIRRYNEDNLSNENNTEVHTTEEVSKMVYDHPQKVYIVGIQHGHYDEMGHIWLDGIENSEKLEITLDVTDTSAYWIFDFIRADYDELKKHLEKSGREKSMDSKFVMLDMSDGGYHFELEKFEALASKYFGEGNVYYATRQQVEGRNTTKLFTESNWTDNSTFFDLGQRAQNDDGYKAKKFRNFGTPVGVLRYCVRSDIVKRIKALSGSQIDLVNRPRSIDVASFWEVDDKYFTTYSYLRAYVSRAVKSLEESHNLNVTVKTVGSREGDGRNGVTDAYSQALIDHKIIVVTQRDQWEGHYRLMEALAGGALVMTDPMHPLPYLFEDGDGIVVYTSLWDLKKKIIHYIKHADERLKIAKRGYYIAMNHHRSWHVMERLLLGNWTENNVY